MSAQSILNMSSDETPVEHSDNVFGTVCHVNLVDVQLKRRERNRLIAVSVICLVFMLLEIIGGYMANSLALMSDAAHLLADFSSFLVGLVAIWMALKPRTKRMSFGFYRAEVLGALFSILLIWLVTGILIYLAVIRIITGDYDIEGSIMIYVSAAGIFANLIMGFALLYQKGSKMSFCLKDGSFNIRSAAIHILGDLLQSVGVLIASIIVYIRPDLKITDPVCTFIFSCIVLFTTVHILLDIIRVLMEGFPKHLDFHKVKAVLYSIDGVLKVHNLRIWTLNMDKVALSAHIVFQKDANAMDILKNASEEIHKQLNIFEVTLQLEEDGNPVCLICKGKEFD